VQQWSLVGRLSASGESCNKLIDPVPFRIGRTTSAALTLPSSRVSSNHAELFTDGEQLFVRDLGSTNGTYVNGVRLADVTQLKVNDVIQFADTALRVAYATPNRATRTLEYDFGEQALGMMQFDRLLHEELVTPFFQPIVHLGTGATVAFEVLARSPLIGLETPYRMFAAASELRMEAELSDLMRRKGVETIQTFHEIPPVYLNTHPVEFKCDNDWGWLSRLRKSAPSQKIVIEVHEAAVTDVIHLSRFRAMLRDFDIGLAFDDFGAGQARITELVALRPDCVKFDREIITQLDKAEFSRQRFVRGLVDVIRDIGVTPLAEGIETLEEQQICADLGFELAQGFFLGMPSPPEQYRDWQSSTSPWRELTSQGPSIRKPSCSASVPGY